MKKKLTVIVVDDSKIIGDRIVSLLKEIPETGDILCGYTFNEGLQLLENNQADLALLDINLPDKSGIELLRLVKEKAYPVKIIIMMTDDPSEAKKAKCFQLGADHFLNKFTEFEKIHSIILAI